MSIRQIGEQDIADCVEVIMEASKMISEDLFQLAHCIYMEAYRAWDDF